MSFVIVSTDLKYVTCMNAECKIVRKSRKNLKALVVDEDVCQHMCLFKKNGVFQECLQEAGYRTEEDKDLADVTFLYDDEDYIKIQ